MDFKTTEDTESTEGFLYKEESYKIRGAIYEVYKQVGSGFLEAVYQECLAKEFEIRGVNFAEQVALNLNYKGELLNQTYKPDFICYNKIIVEIKAVTLLKPEHKAQLINYLKMTQLRVGLLVNFGEHPKARIERVIL